jgi:hypothetical protein
MKTLLVLGATGVMGRRIVRLARRLVPDVRLLQASRRLGAKSQTGTRQVDIQDRSSLRRGLAGVDAAINAVGPFEYDPTALVQCCQEAGCHYVDIAEPDPFIEAVNQAAQRHATADRPVCVVSGCSTVPGLVQVLVQHYASRWDLAGFRILLGMGSDNPSSPTLLYSLLRPLGMPAPDGSLYFARLVRKSLRHAGWRVYGRYPSAFDRAGIRVGGRMVPATFYAGLDRVVLGCVLCLAARVAPRLSDRDLHSLCRLVQPWLAIVRRFGTPVGILSVECLDAQGRVVDEIEVRARREALNVPALPSVWAVRRLLEQRDVLSAGPMSLHQLLSPAQATSWLGQEGYAVRWSGGNEMGRP